MPTLEDAIVAAAKNGALKVPAIRAKLFDEAKRGNVSIPWDRLSASDVASFASDPKRPNRTYMDHALAVASNKKRTPIEAQWLEAMAKKGLIPGTRTGEIMMARQSAEMGSPVWNPNAAVNALRGKKKPVAGKMGSALSGHDPAEALRTAQQQQAERDTVEAYKTQGAGPVAGTRLFLGTDSPDANAAAQESIGNETGVSGAVARAFQAASSPNGMLMLAGLGAGLPAATLGAEALGGALLGNAGAAIGKAAVPLAADAYFAAQAAPGIRERLAANDVSGAVAEGVLGVGPVVLHGVYGPRILREGLAGTALEHPIESLRARHEWAKQALMSPEERLAALEAAQRPHNEAFGAGYDAGYERPVTPALLRRAADPARATNGYLSGRLEGAIDGGLWAGEQATGPLVEAANAAHEAAAARTAEVMARQAARAREAEGAALMGRTAYLREKLGTRAPEPPDYTTGPLYDIAQAEQAARGPVTKPPRAPRKPRGGAANPSPAPAVEVAQGRQLGDPVVAPEPPPMVIDPSAPANPNDIHALGGATDPISAALSGAVDTRLPHESAGVPTRANAAPGEASVDVVRAPDDATPKHLWMSPTSHIDIVGAIERLVPNGAKVSGHLRHYMTVAGDAANRWTQQFNGIVKDVQAMKSLGATPSERWATFQKLIETERSKRGQLMPDVRPVMERYDALTDELGRHREAMAQAAGMKLEDIAPSIKDIGYWSRQHKGGYQVVRPHTNPDGTVRLERLAFSKNMTEASNEALRIINDAKIHGQPPPKLQIIEANKVDAIPGVGSAIGKPRIGANIGRVKNRLAYDTGPEVMRQHIEGIARFGQRVSVDAIIKKAIESLAPSQTATKQYLLDYRKRMVGAPTNTEVMFGNWIRQNKLLRDRVQDPDRALKNWMAWHRSATNAMKLRFNVGSALGNLVQPEQTLAPVVGERIFQKSRAMIRDNWQRMKDMHVLIGDTKYDERANLKGGQKWYDVMSNASNVNRAHGYLAGELHWDTLTPEAKAEFMANGGFKMEKAAKHQYARDMAERTEFDNTVNNRAMILTGPLVETLAQYKGYQIKSLEAGLALWANPKGGTRIQRLGKIARSMALPAIVGGAKGVLPVIGAVSAPFIYNEFFDLAKGRGKSDEEADVIALGFAQGAAAAGGTDVSSKVQAYDAPFGDTPAEKVGGFVLGPTFGSMAKLAPDMWKAFAEPAPHKRETALWNLVVHQVPQSAGPRLAIEETMNPGGGQAAGSKRTESKYPYLDAAKMTFGLQPTVKTDSYARAERKAARRFKGKNLGLGG